MRSRRWWIALWALAGACLLVVFSVNVSAQENPPETSAATQEEAPEEVLHPGPKDLKERWSIYVFVAWMWFSITVLIYFIRLHIREADRVLDLDYYGLEKPNKNGH